MDTSESGQPIYRHQERERDFEPVIGDSDNIDAITEHIQQHIGKVATVFHELVSDLVHIDIHIVNPTPERNYYTLVTSGMSDKPMTTPPGCEELRHAELMLSLPPDWPMGNEEWKKEENYWPVRALKFLARLPHEYQTWLGMMHTIPNGDPSRPFADSTRLCGAIILPPLRIKPEFHQLEISPEKTINFYAVVPLHADEMDFKLKHGAEALFDGFDKYRVTELIDSARPSSLGGGIGNSGGGRVGGEQQAPPKKKWWWPFG